MTERDIFIAARGQTDSSSQIAFLEEACGGDVTLRKRVERLLRADRETDLIVDDPAMAFVGLVETLSQPQATGAIAQRNLGGPDHVDPLHFLTPSKRPGALGRIGDYDVLEVLGRGSFGVVFKALDEGLNRVVAIKVLAPQFAASASSRQRFLHEARYLAAVRHQNVIHVYAVEEQSLPFLVMEFIPGETLQQRLDRVGKMGVNEVIAIGRQIADGLAAAHAIGLIHRDVKPANVFLEETIHGERGGVSPPGSARTAEDRQADAAPPAWRSCSVKLLDFGLARAVDDVSITQSGIILGTPLYMSPEQAQSQPVDQRADLFSLGSVLYALLAGDSPCRANGTLATLKRLSEESPRPVHEVNPATPRWLSDLIAKLLAKNPDDRIGSAREVSALLCAGERGGTSPPVIQASEITEPTAGLMPPRSPSSSVGRRKRVAWAACAVVVLLGAIVFKLKTRNFELTLEVPDSATRQAQATDNTARASASTKKSTTSGENLVKPERNDAEQNDSAPERRAMEFFRTWDSPPRIMLSNGVGFETDTFRRQPLPKTPFSIQEITFTALHFERYGDKLAEALTEPLRDVRVTSQLVLDRGISSAANLTKLVRLPAFSGLSNLALKGDKLDDGLFAEAARLPLLCNLNLMSCPRVTGKGLSALRSHPKFIVLTMVRCPVSVEGLHELRELPHLQYLNLSGVPLTDAHVTELLATPLQHLILGKTELNDAMVERLARHPSLNQLELVANDRITDHSLSAFKTNERLRLLDLNGTSVTAAGVAELQQALPKCQIKWQAKPQP